MNVLIVSENFLDGGLETQINSTVQSLKEKINFFFAFKNYNEKWNYKNVYTNFYFSSSCTIYQFCHDVNTLIKIIKENKIDVIHAHPFYCLFPAVFAAKICGKPIAYTYHGIISYNFTSAINDTLLLNMLSDYEIDRIFCVSTEGNKIFENIILEKDKVAFLPNSINLEDFSPAQISNNKSWALISRLDNDKINEIKKLLNILDLVDIKELHIYGNGSNKGFLEEYIEQKHLNNRVFLKGYCDNLNEELNGKFAGLIGIGRSLMEAISMEYPSILIGYNKIAGVLDSNMYNFIKDKNFTNRGLPDVSIEVLKNQIQNVYNNNYDKSFFKLFKQDFSTQIISDLYIKELEKINYCSLLNLNDLFDEINHLENNSDIFYTSTAIYELLKKHFVFHIRQPHQKNLLILGDTLLTQKTLNNTFNNEIINKNNIINDEITNINTQVNVVNDEITNINTQINNFAESIDIKFTQQEQKLKELSEHSMTYENFKRKLKYKFNKK